MSNDHSPALVCSICGAEGAKPVKRYKPRCTDCLRRLWRKYGHAPRYEMIQILRNMKSRCYDPKHKNYKDYGARGITICDRWLESVDNLIADMGYRPSLNHTVDRIDHNGNYEPGNCRWATWSTQNRNRRISRMITAFGKTQAASAWAEETGIKLGAICKRLDNGWSVERALTLPVQCRTTKKDKAA